MKNIGPFINLGWHTVPLKGALKRLPDGSKTIPDFEKNWKEKYSAKKNETLAKLGGTITGEISGIVAIDCDNSLTYDIFKQLDPEYEFEFRSKGKSDKVCGTMIYEYDEELADGFNVRDGVINLDFYSTDGFVYLPTEANETKHAYEGKLPKLKAMPDIVKQVLLRMRPVKVEVALAPRATNTANCLAPLIKQFTEQRKFMPGLFKIITPKDFRLEPQYQKSGFLHPENVTEGRGSEYLIKVSAILGADVSVDKELYCAAMIDINELWDSPMDSDRLDKTIMEPMIQSKSSIDGVPIWAYDDNWHVHRLILSTKRQSNVELGFDDRRNMYYCVDTANEHVKAFNKDTDIVSYVGSVALDPPKKPDMKAMMPIINVNSQPSRPFGFFNDDDPMARTLNIFIRTPELAILDDPSAYAPLYTKPDTTLKFLESLVPEKEMREYLLRFLKHKLTTFDYSPVVLYFLGVHGSGKDTLVEILEKIMGKMARPTVKEFLELFNGWMLDTYFVQLDEYGNQLTNMRDKEEALGKLKAYTGKQVVQIRQMRTDGFMYHHNATFIMSANTNPFGIEDGDRRIALFSTPNVLREESWVGNVSDVHDRIMAETCDFCYYLATEVGNCIGDEYQKPIESVNKQTIIADNMYPSQRLAFLLKNGMFDYLLELAKDHGSPAVVKAIKRGRIRAKDLEELYEIMTDFKGEMRSLNKAIRSSGIEIKATTTGGSKDYYYNLEELNYDGPFEADEDED